MSQQVNLYQPVFRQQKILFSARTLVILSVGFAAILLLWSTLLSQRVGTLEAELERQRESEQRAMAQLTSLREAMPETTPDETLQARIDQLEQQRAQLRASLQALGQAQPAAAAQLPERLDALSRRQPDGMWLTELSLDERQRDVVLRGRALSASLIPAYLSELSLEPVISGTGFRQVRLEAADDHIPGVHFFISTRSEESRP